MAYPNTQGKKGKGLPDFASPLNINADTGDKLVPENDMAGVAPSMNQGKGLADPMGFLTPIEKGGKK